MRKPKKDWCYCSDCLSPKIYDIFGMPYCADCNSANIAVSTVEDWDELYKKRYKSNYINNKNGRTEEYKIRRF
jgi:hypothetical protein